MYNFNLTQRDWTRKVLLCIYKSNLFYMSKRDLTVVHWKKRQKVKFKIKIQQRHQNHPPNKTKQNKTAKRKQQLKPKLAVVISACNFLCLWWYNVNVDCTIKHTARWCGLSATYTRSVYRASNIRGHHVHNCFYDCQGRSDLTCLNISSFKKPKITMLL